MALQNYKTANNAQGTLLSGISASATALILQTGQGGLFPSTFPYPLEIKEVDTALNNYRVLKREIVLCTDRTGDTLMITRAFEACPNDYTATTQLATAFSFSNPASTVVTNSFTAWVAKDLTDAIAWKMDTVGGLGTWYGTNKHKRVNLSTGADEIKDVSTVIIPTAGDIVRLEKWDWNYEDILYDDMKTDIAQAASPTIQEVNFESIIVAGDSIGQTPDWVYKFQQEVKTSTALGGTNTYLDHCVISTGKYLVLYASGWNVNAVVATLSSGDAMTYWTPVSLWSAATPTWSLALINTNKVVAVYAATASTTAVNIILSISWTTISTGTPLNETQSANCVIRAVCKVRTDCFAYCFGVGTSPSGIKVNTVSGTTISAGTVIATFTYWFVQDRVYCSYLSDNVISFSEQITTNNTCNVKIYRITGWGTTLANTYTGTIASTSTGNVYHARYSDTEVIITNLATAEKSIFTIPWAWSVLVKTTLTANAAANYPTIPLFTNIYGINTGSTILVYQRDILIGTIASTPAHNTQGITYDNWRIIFFNGATLIPTIVNLAKIFIIGVAYNNAWLFTPSKLSAVKTGILKWYRYYFQSDWTISNWIGITNTVDMTKFFGRWLLADRVMVEV